MAQNKTKLTDASVESYLAAIQDETRRKDCEALSTLMSKATKEPPKMWGSSIVGFGSYHYKYESGREGDSCLVGFSSRKDAISIYLARLSEQEALLAQLGKYKMGKGCLYVRRLDDVDLKVLERLISGSVTERKRNDGFLSLLSAPARRALEREGITSVKQLARYSEAEILALHGIGPSSLPKLRQALQSENQDFRQP